MSNRNSNVLFYLQVCEFSDNYLGFRHEIPTVYKYYNITKHVQYDEQSIILRVIFSSIHSFKVQREATKKEYFVINSVFAQICFDSVYN